MLNVRSMSDQWTTTLYGHLCCKLTRKTTTKYQYSIYTYVSECLLKIARFIFTIFHPQIISVLEFLFRNKTKCITKSCTLKMRQQATGTGGNVFQHYVLSTGIGLMSHRIFLTINLCEVEILT
jgi:hypothetical protein